MFTKTLAAAAAILIGTTAVASAASINERQYRQNYRIYKGVQNGKLTYGEFRSLERGQRRVQRLENIIKRDGYVSPFERSVMHAYQNYESQRIYNLKHN